MIVVEQPIPRGTDVLSPIGSLGQPGVSVLENTVRSAEAGEQRRAAPGPTRLPDALLARLGLGPVSQVFGAQQFPADRSGEQFLTGAQSGGNQPREKAPETAWGRERGGLGWGTEG